MRLTRLLAERSVPELRSVTPEDFDALFEAARHQSRESIRRWGGWIFVFALVLPYLLFIGLPIIWFARTGISFLWVVLLVPMTILISSSLSEFAYFRLIHPALQRLASARWSST